MDVDEDDDFYAPEESIQPGTEDQSTAATVPQPIANAQQEDGDLEEGEEEDEAGSEGSDSDIDIITERKDGSKPAPPSQSRYNTIQNINQRNIATDVTAKLPAIEKEKAAKGTPPVSGADLPGLSISKIDVNAKPVYEPAGKPITQVSIDEDLPENEKPWRRPGTDISDYFNYGFDEFTWALYASKQETLRSEFDQEKIAQNSKKMFEDMNMMMAMGGMPGMMPGAGGAVVPGMEGITPEMQQMMQQMMASGMDPSQMDPTMFAGMQSNQAGAGGGGNTQGGQGQAFGGQGFGQGGYGYDQSRRGRGGRRNWGN